MLCSSEDIAAICRKHINLSLLSANNHTLCVDGTSCTKKTTILNKTADRYGNVSKIQHNYKVRNPDSFFPSMLGYMCDGVLAMLRGRPHFNDRAPTNVLEWHFLWSIMDNFVQMYGNVRPKMSLHAASLKLYRQVFEQLKLTDYYKLFRNKTNGIAIIDSNLDRCDGLHLQRNESTDAERGTWRFYTPLQNLMYETLYEGLYIDLAWFDEYSVDDFVIINGIAIFCEETLDFLCNNRNVDHVPLEDCRLPTPSHDYYLSNITTHVYRSIGRWGCKRIHAENLAANNCEASSSSNVGNSKRPRYTSLTSYIPEALSVDNITNHRPINGKSVRHLLTNVIDDATNNETDEDITNFVIDSVDFF